MKIQILGCGSSGGVPVATGFWGQCDPSNPKNRRWRSSVAVFIEDAPWIIDVGPDFRAQCLAFGLSRIKGALISHGHFDHMGGLEELKPFAMNQGHPIPVWMDDKTFLIVEKRLGYGLDQRTGAPFIEAKPLGAAVTLDNMEVKIFEQDHGVSTSLGFRFPSWAYSTDVVRLEDKALAQLRDLDLWIVDCVSVNPSLTHAHLERVLEWVHALRPRRVVLTHMGLGMDYARLSQSLPAGIEPAYDGMILEV